MSNPLALIIEDDMKLAELFAIALRQAEYEPQIANDGANAIGQLATTVPTMVLLDLHVPYLSGRDILYKIKADPRLTNTRVILTTADPLSAEELQDKVDLVLIKPIGFTQLRDMVRRFREP